MIDAAKIEREVDELDDMKGGSDKLARAKEILEKVKDAERACAADFSIPFDEVRRVRNIIPIINATVARLEAGAVRRAGKGA